MLTQGDSHPSTHPSIHLSINSRGLSRESLLGVGGKNHGVWGWVWEEGDVVTQSTGTPVGKGGADRRPEGGRGGLRGRGAQGRAEPGCWASEPGEGLTSQLWEAPWLLAGGWRGRSVAVGVRAGDDAGEEGLCTAGTGLKWTACVGLA